MPRPIARRMPYRLLAAALCAFSLSAPLPAMADEVVVFAAASMKTALDKVATAFQAETGNHVLISYGGSGALAKQIIEGAPADVFISAASNWMDEVEKAGLIAAGQRVDLLGNRLVLVAHDKNAPAVEIGPGLDLVTMLGSEGRLSMAQVASVPAGQYGKAALETLGLWDGIAPRVVQTENVRAALALVASGETPLGIVYATDAQADSTVSVIGRFPEGSHPPIRYPAALLAEAGDAADLAFFQALSAPAAQEIFASQGFLPRP